MGEQEFQANKGQELVKHPINIFSACHAPGVMVAMTGSMGAGSDGQNKQINIGTGLLEFTV